MARAGGNYTFNKRDGGCVLKDHDYIDYKDTELLLRFIASSGKIIPGRVSSVSAKKQRMLTQAIKRARFMALLPYVAG